MLARWDGDLARCRVLYAESLALYRELNLDTGALDVLDGLAAVEVAEGRAEMALRLLTVTSREWDRLGTIPFSPDRADDREATLRAARTTLGSRADGVAAAAAGVSLEEVVRSL
jgi:hypothetical protein